MKLNVTWSLDTGRVRPPSYSFELDVERDIMDIDEWNALSDSEKREELEEFVQAEFENKISWNIDTVEEV